MKSYLLPYPVKALALLALLSSAGLLYAHQPPAALLTGLLALASGLFSAERREDERTRHLRLLALRTSAFSSLGFIILFSVLVAMGRCASPALFCVVPVSLLAYLASFYGPLWLPTRQPDDE